MATEERKVQLVAEVDASGAKQGFSEIKADARDMAQSVTQAGQQAGKGIDAIGAGGEQSAQKLDRSTKSIIASIQRTTAAMEAGSRGTSQYYEAIAAQRGANVDVLKPYLAQLDAAVEKQNAARQSLNGVGLSAGQLSQALRSVPAQFTDIVTSLASGQAPMTVMIQQGGQLKDMFGGVGAAARALGGYVMGMVNPLTLTLGAVGALAYAYHQGSSEASGFAKSVILSGNAASASVNQLQNLQLSVQSATGATKGAIAEALNQIVATGRVASDSLGMVAASALNMNRATGKAIADTVDEFASLGKEPVKASEKLNEQYNYLTASVYAQIKALEDQGKTTEAAALAQKTYAEASDAMAVKLKANLGTLESAWASIASGAKQAWDSMLDIGREGSLEQRIAKARATLEGKGFLSGGNLFGGAEEARAQLAVMEAQAETQKRQTEEQEKQNSLNRAGIEWEKTKEKYLSKQQQMEVEIVKARNLGLAAGRSELEINKRIAEIREKFSEKGKSQATKDAEELAALLDKVSGKKAGLDASYWSDLETLRKAYQKGKLTLEEYQGAVANLTKEQKFAKDAEKAGLEAVKSRSELVGKMAEDERKRSDSLIKGNVALRDEIAMLGMSKAEQDLYKAAKLDSAAASDLATASSIDAMKAEWELNGVLPEIISGYEALAEAKRASAAALSEQASLTREKAAKEVAVKQAEDSAKAWEKFSDDINRSLTDSLYRAFESGESFGTAFAKSLQNTFKAMALKLAVQYTISATGSLIGSAGNAAANYVLGTSSSNNGAGNNYFGIASNANTVYGMASGSYLGYWQAAQAGYGMTAQETAAAAQAYYNAGYYGTGASLQLGNTVGTAGNSASSTTGTGASEIGSTIATSVAAVLAAYTIANWIKDEQYGNLLIGSLFGSYLQGGLMGKTRMTGSQVTGMFSEDQMGFSGQQGISYKKSGGLFSKSKEWTEWFALPTEVDSALDSMYRSIRASFMALGTVFEDTTLADKLKGFAYSFTAGELSAESIAAGLSEAMSGVLTPSVNAARKAGESWAGAFQRVLGEANAVSRVLDLMGDSLVGTFGKNNLDGILRASDAFVQLFGSVDAFNAAFSGYFSNFYTASEQAAQSWRDLKTAFENIGQAMPTTRQGFRDLVDSLDLSTDAGRTTFAQLMSLQSAFAALTPTLEDAATAAKAMQVAAQEMQAQQIGNYYAAMREAEKTAVQQQMTQAQAAASTASSLVASYTAIRDSLSSYRLGLGTTGAAGSSPMDRYQAARAAFDSTSALAQLGNVDAANSLQGVAEALLNASKEVGSATDYARDVAKVIGTVDRVIGVADRQIPIAESQLQVAQDSLTALQAILDKLNGGSVPAVVANYQAAATDWAQFFATTAVGQSVQTSAGTMQRLSESMALFIDQAGRGFAFNQSDNPYTLAGQSEAYRQYLLQKYGAWSVPAFAAGGVHTGGLRLVGENGPELEFTGPSNIVNASATADMLGNASAMGRLVSQLLDEIAELREEQRIGNASIVNATNKTARLLEKFDLDGLPEVRAA